MILRSLAVLIVGLQLSSPAVDESLPARGSDELFWVPTLAQALEMAKANDRPIFMMGYSLVDTRSTYTKIGPEYCSSVF